MAVHKLVLKEKYYDLAFAGKKSIEVQLLDSKYQKIKLHDTLQISKANTTAYFEAEVVGLFNSVKFETLFEIVPAEKCGYDDKKSALQILNNTFTENLQNEFGVVGIVYKH